MYAVVNINQEQIHRLSSMIWNGKNTLDIKHGKH